MQNGESLTEEEHTVISETRERMRKKEKEAEGIKSGKPSKVNNKGKEDKKKKPQIEESINNTYTEKPLPEPDFHVSNDIKSFLSHYKGDRLI